MLRAAFYKGTRPGLAGGYNRLVRFWENGAYSHCELVFPDGAAASASWLDKGVRFKEIEFDPARWDLIDLPHYDEATARQWFVDHEGDAYDLAGQLHFVVSPAVWANDKWFCSEAVAAALGYSAPWRYGPNILYSALAGNVWRFAL